MQMKKVILIVLDSVGIGALPDADRYGDAGAHTLRHVVNACHTRLPNLTRLGLCNIEGAGFGTDTNIVTLISHGGTETLPLMSKREVAHRIWDAALALHGAKR